VQEVEMQRMDVMSLNCGIDDKWRFENPAKEQCLCAADIPANHNVIYSGFVNVAYGSAL